MKPKNLSYPQAITKLSEASKAFQSVPAKINFWGEGFMLFVIIAYITKSSIKEVAIIIASIWNEGLTPLAGDNTLLMLFFGFIAFAAVCTIFCAYIRNDVKNTDNKNSNQLGVK